jgi:cytochrome b pre-mRNA-processing protein 3
MLQWFRRRAEGRRRAGELYGSVVTAARQPVFYRDMGVPDTPEGRFELVALHLFLALEALKQRDLGQFDVTQRTIEAFVTDMDDCMREMGVGDLTVPKKVKRAAAAFYERAGAYRRALSGGHNLDLETSLGRYVFAGSRDTGNSIGELAGYVRNAAAALSVQPFDKLLASGGLLKPLSGRRAEGT